ncbi:MAG: carbohydrate ABC transporter permease [Cellulosilyticaceae bacterium]
MAIRESKSRKVFNIINMLFLLAVTVVCVLPFIHLLALSLSSDLATAAGEVGLLPKDFSLEAYKFLLQKKDFFRSMGVSVIRVIVGTSISLGLVILTAYPLSKENERFKSRTLYVWFFAVTMFFGGGLIPTYMVIKELHLIDTIWALVLPGALSVWNVVLLLNFFRQIPKELEEAALIDGAGQLTILFKLFVPIALPAIATLLLFTMVGHWNSWFDGVMYLNSPKKYPLQTYLSTIVLDQNLSNLDSMSPEQLKRMEDIGSLNLKSAQIFMGALPILCVYPFLQRFFVKGIVVGSVKG